jgi:homoserine O-succinyltransferase
LAAHAAVLHIDGIGRHRLWEKRFGVFECAKASAHPLTAMLPPRSRMPHSRWNDIPEDALRTCGYRVVTRSEDAGVDTFVKQRRSLFVFFQGHPEYEADTLLREYRRDIRRFLRQETDSYPSMPQDYFDQDTIQAMKALQERALSNRREELLSAFPMALAAGRVMNTWRSTAVCVYRAWLMYLCAQKDQRLKVRRGQRGFKRARAVTYGSAQSTWAQAPDTGGGATGEVNGHQIGRGV